jgi:hypothetical protein
MIHLIKTIIECSFPSCFSDTVWTFEKTVVNFEGPIEEIMI